jgi:CRP-like cAMP-binding protein
LQEASVAGANSLAHSQVAAASRCIKNQLHRAVFSEYNHGCDCPTPKIKNLDKLLMHCQRRRYQAKSNIICAGDRSETLFFIIKGSVTILIEDDDGREMIIAYLNTGDFLR